MGFSTTAYCFWCSPFTFRTVLRLTKKEKDALVVEKSLSHGKTQELKGRNTILCLSNKRAQPPLQALKETLISCTANYKYTTINSFCPPILIISAKLGAYKNKWCKIVQSFIQTHFLIKPY